MASQVDLLNEDPIISNQKYVCISFVSPEDLLKRKELKFVVTNTENHSLFHLMEKLI